MAHYRIERKLAGGVIVVGWILVMFAAYGVIVGVVFAIKDGTFPEFGPVLALVSYGLPMILLGAACRAVFEIADRTRPGDPDAAHAPDANVPRPADTP